MKKLLILIFLSKLFSQGVWMMNDRTHPELNWKTNKTKHFNIHYHNGIKDIAIKGATIAEQVIPTLMKQMGLDKLPILDVIFTNEDEVMNGYAMFTNQTFIWVDQNDAAIWLEDEKWLKQVLTHELQHLVFMNAVKTWMPEPWSMSIFGQIPSWFIEGLAEYYTERWRPYRADISHKFHVLTNSTHKMDPHHDGYSKVLYLSEKFSDDTILKIVQYRTDLKLYDFKKAFKKSTGVSVEKFEEDWLRTMNTYYYGYRAQKEAIEELGKTATLPVKNVSTFKISSDSTKIVIVGRDDVNQYDHSLILAERKLKKEDQNFLNLNFNIKKLFKSDIEDTIKQWKKPQFNKNEIDFGRMHSHLEWSSDNKKIAYSKYRRGNHGSMLWDIKVYDTEIKKSKWITKSMRATYPIWINNNEDIIFIAHQNSTAQFYQINLETNKISQLTKYVGDVSIFSPALSPNQESIVFSMAPEDGNSDLYLLNLKSNNVQRLTSDPAVDYLPIWDPNGKRIAYTSHQSNTPNIHVLNLEDKSTHQITDVGDAVWTHQWTPNDSTILLKTLWDTDTTRLVMIDLDRKINTNNLNIRNRYSSWINKAPNDLLPSVNFSDIPEISSAKKYSFTKHIKHLTSVVLPLPFPIANTAWTDALGKHQLLINIGSLDYEMILPFGGFNYTNASSGPFWGISYNKNQYFKFRNYNNSVNGLTEIVDGITLWTRTPYNSGESLSSNHNFYYSLFIGSLRISPLVYADSTSIGELPDRDPEEGKLGEISFQYNFLSRRDHKLNNFFPKQGYGLKIQLDISHKNLMSDFNFSEITIDAFNNYNIGEFVLYSRLKGIAQFGLPPTQDKIHFSTDKATYIPTIGISDLFPENMNLRGSNEYIPGNSLFFGTIEFRNKIMEGDLPINIIDISAGDITSALITDFGNIWTGTNKKGDFISTIGFEIKFSLKSSGFPIMNLAYGYAEEIKNINKLEDLNHYYRVALINPF